MKAKVRKHVTVENSIETITAYSVLSEDGVVRVFKNEKEAETHALILQLFFD